MGCVEGEERMASEQWVSGEFQWRNGVVVDENGQYWKEMVISSHPERRDPGFSSGVNPPNTGNQFQGLYIRGPSRVFWQGEWGHPGFIAFLAPRAMSVHKNHNSIYNTGGIFTVLTKPYVFFSTIFLFYIFVSGINKHTRVFRFYTRFLRCNDQNCAAQRTQFSAFEPVFFRSFF